MIDWTSLTNDPVDNQVRDKVIEYLFSIRKFFPKGGYDAYLVDQTQGKRVLDIGICEHVQERMKKTGWKHQLICDNAEYVLGVDIIEDLISELKSEDYNVIYCDATSDINLNEKFDIVHIGDVIEHVANPIDLINFALRHLNDNGKILVRTPNAYCFNYVYLNKKIGTDKSNLEHLFYIFPIHALEMARRTNCIFSNYFVLKRRGIKYALYFLLKIKFRHAFAELFAKPEQYSTIYCYEFKK